MIYLHIPIPYVSHVYLLKKKSIPYLESGNQMRSKLFDLVKATFKLFKENQNSIH